MPITEVILVDEKDQPCGRMEKMEAHRAGALHRAFSIFIFNRKGEMLLQQRAKETYHSGGLWTNACCSHPIPGEKTKEAAQRRLMEELGFCTEIQKVFDFLYKADFENGLTEHEFDHVFAGEYEGEINFNRDEVSEVCYQSIPEIRDLLGKQPQKFTAWFHLAFPRVENWWLQTYNGKPA
ncbi:MAG: isopentenyl-diphosphate Delta-isomerase [Bacteroidetes bacterium]|nr:isopentenyl-diphosphate Delta-isomerase [Bacteroidota bacterium]